MTKSTHVIVILLMSLLISSCGFQLRGYGESATLPEFLQTLELNSPDPGNGVTRQLRNQLRSSDVTIIEESQDDIYQLTIGQERTQERVISLNSSARAGEYALSLSVTVQLQLGATTQLGPETISIERMYLADPNNAVAKTEEAELIMEEMQRDLASQIINRLQSLDAP